MKEVRPESGIWRVRISDPTGAFIGFVSKYQPEALESLLEIEPPEMVVVVVKVRIFEGDDRTLAFIRPESIAVVDRETRDYWIFETSKATIERIREMENGVAEDVKLARGIYSTDLNEYRKAVEQALTALRENIEISGRVSSWV